MKKYKCDCGKFVIAKKINSMFVNAGEDYTKHYIQFYCPYCIDRRVPKMTGNKNKPKIVNLSRLKHKGPLINFINKWGKENDMSDFWSVNETTKKLTIEQHQELLEESNKRKGIVVEKDKMLEKLLDEF